MLSGTESLPHPEIAGLLGPQLTAEQARLIYDAGPDAVIFALLTLARQAVLQAQSPTVAGTDPSCPSGQTPTYLKSTGKRRRKRPGAKLGHPGRRRPTPEPNAFVTHTLEACPACGGAVKPLPATRTRIIEDIPEDITPVVTAHTIPRYYCKTCGKSFEPTVPDALPGSQIGVKVVVLSAWLHYLLGTTLGQILDVFNFHLSFPLTSGGLMQSWHRLREVLQSWYLEIEMSAKASAVLHADETGWRVNGKTHWLWCFTNDDTTYYHIDPGRGKAVVKKFFKKAYEGVLVTDFWGAYNAVVCANKQKCLPHLLRDIKRTTKYHKPGSDWPLFAKRLKRLIRDSLRLQKSRGELTSESFVSRRNLLQSRLDALIHATWEQKHARRLVKRLRRHRLELLTFLDVVGVPPDNNHGEREIRPAVIMRKNSYANGSPEGATTQAALMSIFRTLKRRGHDPIRTVINALRTYLKTGHLPPLPSKITTNG
jgi:transposase